MKIKYSDPLILSTFSNASVNAILQPMFVTLLFKHLNEKVFSLSILLSAVLSILVGLMLENKKLFDVLYTNLKVLLFVEVLLVGSLVVVSLYDIPTYYICFEFVVGTVGNVILYQMQKVKEIMYVGNRAEFDRKTRIVSSAGLIAGSSSVLIGLVSLPNLTACLIVETIQFMICNALAYAGYKKVKK